MTPLARRSLARRRHDGERGQGLFEWGAIVVFIAIVVIVVLQVLGKNVSSAFCKTNSAFSGSCALYVANTGTNTAVQFQSNASGNSKPATTITTGVGARGVALDAKQSLWVANSTANTITKYPSGATTPTVTITVAAGSSPFGVAFDSAGNLWVANRGASAAASSITEYSAANIAATGSPAATVTITGAGLSFSTGIAFDGAGNLWVASNTGGPGPAIFGIIAEYKKATIAASYAGAPDLAIDGANTLLNGPTELAFNSSGTLFVCNNGGTNILEWTSANLISGNTAPSVNFNAGGSNLNSPRGLAIDASNNLWVVNQGNSSITEYLAANLGAGSAPAITISGGNTGLSSPYGIALG